MTGSTGTAGGTEEVPQARVEEVVRVIAACLIRAGRVLYTCGALLGGDRVAGRSRWGYGDDRVVGVAVASEVAADLANGAAELLRVGHRYAAMALLRQIVEVEYLLWIFAHDEEQARRWLNADEEELWKFFRPAELRTRSAGQFRVEEYKSHCAVGGHPSPKSRSLLSDHSIAVPVEWLWSDLAMHLSRLWPSLMKVVDRVGLRSDLLADVDASVVAALGYSL